MTRVRIVPPDAEEDVSAEQVAAYLLRPGSGWVEWSTVNTTRAFRMEVTATTVIVSVEPDAVCIKRIARAEDRHPSAVLADIVGPARPASVGVRCAAHGPWADEFPCGDTLDGCNRDSAARGAGESEE